MFKEHTFNAGVSRYAQELLEANGFEVVQLQPLNDEDEIFLNERVEKARTFGADLLFSIHADANGNRDARGHWCFYWHDHGQSKRLAQIWISTPTASFPIRIETLYQACRERGRIPYVPCSGAIRNPSDPH
ncbi:N-acetylmuramoyl-L-alanine amidase family protein [Paenibacillus silviterrae]|uniref:N-acetylmuramoyl-L-alanine amidase family protein n=1 Tax=Paenibacillus silviterrae TaxID=3242194 RepID=UPI00350E3BFF